MAALCSFLLIMQSSLKTSGKLLYLPFLIYYETVCAGTSTCEFAYLVVQMVLYCRSLSTHRVGKTSSAKNAVRVTTAQAQANIAQAHAAVAQTVTGSQAKLGVPLTHGWWRQPRASGTAVQPPVAAAVPPTPAVNLVAAVQRHTSSAPVLFPPNAQWWKEPTPLMTGQPAPAGVLFHASVLPCSAPAHLNRLV